VTIQTRVPVCLEKHEFIERMGKFVLRDEGETIALGKVLRYKPYVASKTKENLEEKIKQIVDRVDEEEEKQSLD
jgi:hypothetical protein